MTIEPGLNLQLVERALIFQAGLPIKPKLVIPDQAGIQLIELGFAGLGKFLPNLREFLHSGGVSAANLLRVMSDTSDPRLRT